MSRDIRSYFSFPKGQSKNAPAAKPSKINKKPLSSDEEDSHASPNKNKAKKTKKTGNHIISDSEDEDTVTKKPVSKSPSTTGKDKVKEKEKELKPVTLDSIFSKEPVKRKSAPAPIPKKLKEAEASFHDDKEFEATLSQLDTTEIETIFQNKDKTKDKEKKLDQFSGKRKPSDSDKETSPKKIKLSEDVKTEKDKSKVKDKNSSHSKLEVEVDNKQKKKQKNDADEVYEENIAKKKQHAVAYQQYLHRGGARNPGSKTIPKGAENCLAGLSFVVTGVLESLEREEVDELIKQYGGRVVGNLSKKTNYLVVGDAAGESKMAKADSLHVKKISEDELLEMIRSRPAGKSSAVIPSRSKKNSSFNKSTDDELKPSPSKKVSSEVKAQPVKSEDVEMKSVVNIRDENIFKAPISSKEASTFVASSEKASTSKDPAAASASKIEFVGNDHVEALVEKYRPKMMKQIIGQHTDKSCARKLHAWILNWHKNQHGKVKPPKPSPWAKNDDGAFYKAALLSGPPGIGKTTTAQVVCNELGFDLVEFNASDTRSKRLLKEEVSTLLSNTSVKGYFSSNKEDKTSRKHVLLMDEVDGMAGNEDRGGLQELINLIKAADVPIICICNDRNHPKMRTLANYTFDLRFQKPKLEQIRGAMKSLCCKENISISTENLDRLIQSTNFDIRQVINHLAMLKGEPVEKKEGRISGDINKDLKLGPWDVVRKVFSAEEHKNMSIHDKSDLFFHDYNIAGLFVQENYLSVVPKVPKDQILERVAKSADSLSMGDLVEQAIRQKNAWALLPAQACYSSVIPGSLMSGHIGAQINFPSWLGRNSKRNKFDRILQEITVHTRLVTGASKEAINIDYLNALRDKITRPLALNGTEGVDSAVDVMNHYHLLREDLDGIVEVSLWPGQRDPFQVIDSKVRAAFTRSYNKNSTLTPFAATASKKKGGGDLTSEDSGYMEAGEETISDSDNDDDSLEADRMVKAKKTAPKKEPAKTATKKTTSKASADKPASRRGRGRGK